ncbi:MAG: SDR family NAD(P)-dependent oxidoreductase [Xanthomonadales bacterium]|nr:SDR family NAD(P)-dependent oxidoreductase [Xanthomonadales bacterium]
MSPSPDTAHRHRTGPPVAGLGRPARVLVTGASGGVGGALVAALDADPGVAVLLAVGGRRQPALPRPDLPGRHSLACDLTDPGELAGLATRAGELAGGGLDLVINAAGLLHGPGVRPEKALAQLRLEALQAVFAVNAFAPVLLAQALLPLLRHGEPAVFASLSARVGSIGDNRLGGWYAYRAAKAAQNQLMRSFAIELRRLNPAAACLLLHPGTVDTALSQPFRAGLGPTQVISPTQAAGHLLAVIANVSPADSGSFLAWDGRPIPW